MLYIFLRTFCENLLKANTISQPEMAQLGYSSYVFHTCLKKICDGFKVSYSINEVMDVCLFLILRETARSNCSNGGNRWLPALHAVCKVFQLYCEGEILLSSSQMMSTNVCLSHTHTLKQTQQSSCFHHTLD